MNFAVSSDNPLSRTETRSTTVTEANILFPGHGLHRLVGKMGSSLEDVLGRAAHKMGFGPIATRIRLMQNISLLKDGSDPADDKKIRKDCKRLVSYTNSQYTSKTQLQALTVIKAMANDDKQLQDCFRRIRADEKLQDVCKRLEDKSSVDDFLVRPGDRSKLLTACHEALEGLDVTGEQST